MSTKIECTECLGMGKKLIRKAGTVKMVTCKSCAGKGNIVVKAMTKPAKKKNVKASAANERSTKRALKDGVVKPEGVRVTTRDIDSGNDVIGKMSPEQREAKETIEDRAAFFGCPGKVRAVRKGPVITLYEFAPARATRIKRLIALQEDLALALSAEAVMVRRIPGKEVMGIEISNESDERQNVAFRASLASVRKAKADGMELPMNLGTDPFGDPIVDDLATMPHLLIAGSTGSGKSVSLNCIISSLLTVCPPSELEFYMIDPKGVELTHYNGIPHMKRPMVTSPHYAKDMLEHLVEEMRARLLMLTRQGVRDIKEYNDLAKKLGTLAPMPRIVCVIDELGDLMMQDRRAFTRLIAEISQIARATGIHMIAATQRPSVDVLSGRIKVNFPARMAFKVTSSVDSRTIVHRKGAEALLGRGDMLYQSPIRSACIRIHAPWVPLIDVKEIANKLIAVEKRRLQDEQDKRAALEAQRLKEARERMPSPTANIPRTTLRQGEEETMQIDFGYNLSPKK